MTHAHPRVKCQQTIQKEIRVLRLGCGTERGVWKLSAWGQEVAKGILHFLRAVSGCGVLWGHECHLNWQIKTRMISSHTERGEEIRSSSNMEMDVTGSSITRRSGPLSSPFSSVGVLPPAMHLVLDLFSLTLSLHLSFLSALLPWLQHHPYMKCICRVHEEGENESNLVQQNAPLSVQPSIDERIICHSTRKTDFL